MYPPSVPPTHEPPLWNPNRHVPTDYIYFVLTFFGLDALVCFAALTALDTPVSTTYFLIVWLVVLLFRRQLR